MSSTGDFNNNGGNSGSAQLYLGGDSDKVTVAGNLTNTAVVSLAGTNDSVAVTGNLTNSYVLGLYGTNDSVSVTGAFSNTNTGGVVIYGPHINGASGNTLTVATWSNLDSPDGNLTGGYYDIGGVFQYSAPANGITSIGSGVEVDLAPGGLITPDGHTDALAGLASNAGALYLDDYPESFTPAGSPGTFSNSGGLHLYNDSGSTTSLTVNGNFDNSGITQFYGSSAQGLSVTGNSSNEGTVEMDGPGDSFSTKDTFNNNSGTNSGGSFSLTGASDQVSVTGNFNNNAGASVTMKGTNGRMVAAMAFIDSGTVALSGTGDILSAASFTNTGGNVFVLSLIHI